MKNFTLLLFSILLTNLAGIFGSLFTFYSVDTWYQTIEKPAITPASWVFGPVWTFLYILMGISFYFIVKLDINDKKVRMAIFLFVVQLILNALWSVIFFGAHRIDLAFLEILILLAFIVATFKAFYKLDQFAAYLLLPYIVWVSFATFLNFEFLLLTLR